MSKEHVNNLNIDTLENLIPSAPNLATLARHSAIVRPHRPQRTQSPVEDLYPTLPNNTEIPVNTSFALNYPSTQLAVIPKQIHPKRSRSADSPRDSDDEKQLVQFRSEDDLPDQKRNRILHEVNVLRTQLVEGHNTLSAYHAKLTVAQVKKKDGKVEKLTKQIKDKNTECQLIASQLHQTEQK